MEFIMKANYVMHATCDLCEEEDVCCERIGKIDVCEECIQEEYAAQSRRTHGKVYSATRRP